MGTRTRSWLPRVESRLMTKVNQGVFLGDGAVLYLGCGGGYMIVGIYQNSKNCTLKIVNFAL